MLITIYELDGIKRCLNFKLNGFWICSNMTRKNHKKLIYNTLKNTLQKNKVKKINTELTKKHLKKGVLLEYLSFFEN